ncbi:hypothetical protein SAMD00019534_013590, partial [Acytostelium subglobosum LB1]|uniref:hypothetical protein n=1 Tax=Acytostelium subglobosum LB1 TaxID=1410327 RepID=UPI000644AAEE
INIRERLNAILNGVKEGKYMEEFEKYYHKDVVMIDTGDTTNRVGKEQNRKTEQTFYDNSVLHEVKVNKILVDGNNSAYEIYMHFTNGGVNTKWLVWSIQEWKDGLIIKEEFWIPGKKVN